MGSQLQLRAYFKLYSHHMLSINCSKFFIRNNFALKLEIVIKNDRPIEIDVSIRKSVRLTQYQDESKRRLSSILMYGLMGGILLKNYNIFHCTNQNTFEGPLKYTAKESFRLNNLKKRHLSFSKDHLARVYEID